MAEAIETLGMNETSQGLRWVSEKEKENDEYIYLALEQAENFNAKAVYFRFFDNPTRPPRPQVYIYDIPELDSDHNEDAEIHHRLWNAGIVPYCFIFRSSQILVYNCGLKPDWNQDNAHFITKEHDCINLLSETQKKIRQYHARQFDSGLFWDLQANKNYKYGQSAYEQLLNQLKNVKAHIIDQVGYEKAGLVKRVLMMLILIKYLEERKDENGKGALDPEEFYKDYNPESPTLEGVLKDADTFANMLNDLSSKEHFNGQIFGINDNELANLRTVDLVVFQHFVKGETSILSSSKYGLGQMSLWRLYQFNYLPIELISHIYEDFLADEDGKKKKGVVYTPPYLVQFLIDRCMSLNEPREQFKVLDPACGSGIFLVGAFKRIIQWWRVKNSWAKPTKDNINELKKLLKENIYGCDLEEEAVTLTSFSLDLALLDSLSPKEIWKNVHFDNLIDQNLFSGDFFKTLHENKLCDNFDLVIGNPPFEERFTEWADIVNNSSRNEITNRPEVPQKQIALLFLEQSFKLLKEGGKSCLILPSGPVLYNTKVHSFRKYLLETNYFKAIFDFTPLRAKLFIGSSSSAKPPVVAVFAERKNPKGEIIQHLIFRRTKASSEKVEFEIDHYDIHATAYNKALSIPGIWQANFMGGGRLHRLVEKIYSVPSLESYLNEKIKSDGWKVGEGWIESSSAKSIQRIHALSIQEVFNKEEEEELKKLKSKHEADWITGYPFVETEDFTEDGISQTKTCVIQYFYRSAKTNKEIFRPPHLLIKEQSGTASIPIEFRDDYLTFRNEVIGISAPEKDSKILQEIATRIKGNVSYSALLWLLSGRIISTREGVVLKNDILSLPYPEKKLEFDFVEKILLDDVSKYYSEFRKEGEKSEILSPAVKSDLTEFGEIYCRILNSIYDNFKPLKAIVGKDFIAYPFILGSKPEIEIPETLEGVEEKLKELIDHQVSYNLWVKRIIKVYHKNVILLYKPNQKRYWLKSIAIRDADETFNDLYKQGK
ncbi:SAM-dependent methyltransferase [Zunongwangia sp. M21534]|uniref:site-specific DNA-methyltransferase (adenine-specific) n=1 Tax=Zunongwangia pacifica TaxID=2911062 RepID=A0A9X1ZQ97_9FLAO|nr:SAM-dependent methyltransferase [Zunongwangia pacifica]